MPPPRFCACPVGTPCVASPDGKRIGRVSIISDLHCRSAETMQHGIVPTALPAVPDAPALLDAAAGHLRQRAAAYDKPGGERSMAATVAAFNAITKHKISESEGWLFMECLKAVRDFTTSCGHPDSQEDRIAYAALGAEARRAGR